MAFMWKLPSCWLYILVFISYIVESDCMRCFKNQTGWSDWELDLRPDRSLDYIRPLMHLNRSNTHKPVWIDVVWFSENIAVLLSSSLHQDQTRANSVRQWNIAVLLLKKNYILKVACTMVEPGPIVCNNEISAIKSVVSWWHSYCL